ncbi:MAG: SUMF1/EgtB/PvdO family nonheme iron enzyme, partial [Myxococcota bacterium]
GRGGVGIVYRVYDPKMDRVLAMKVLQMVHHHHPDVIERFLREARLTARLQHPGIVPVYEIGALSDGRPFFTMQEVRGRNLYAAIRALHDRNPRHRRPLLEAFVRVCETLAFAHANDIVHCDLKPANVMIGRFGQTRLLDWGLAASLEEPTSNLGIRPLYATAGTPGYMAPEQADPTAQITPAADTYALGALLFEILVGQPPVLGADGVSQRVGDGPTLIPTSIRRILERALQIDPSDRHPNAGVFWAEVSAWLAGATRHSQAQSLVDEADNREKLAAELSADAEQHRAASAALIQQLTPWESDSRRQDAWRFEQEAERLDIQAARTRAEGLNALHAALRLWPDLTGATDRLADHYHREHQRAEQRQDMRAAARIAFQLQNYGAERYQDYLQGDGSLDLDTSPPAEVQLHRYVEQERHLTALPERTLGTSPVRNAPLSMGSYLVILSAPGRLITRYPVFLPRQHRWTGIPPGTVDVAAVVLPALDELDATQEAYVPAGWFLAGPPQQMRRYWVDAFVIQRYPITHAQYLVFLNALVDQGQVQEALRWAPRTRSEGQLLYAWSSAHGFRLSEGTPWEMDSPVIMINWSSACAYARWWCNQTGHDWRLPSEWEWEKAGRGVDGRIFPWGDHFEHTRCANAMSHAGRRHPWPIGAFAMDQSPYRVCDLSGGVRDWCVEPLSMELPADGSRIQAGHARLQGGERLRSCRGGSWQYGPARCCLHYRETMSEDYRSFDLGFRLVRSYRADTRRA